MVPTMVSTFGIHYPYGSFIKEIVTIPNLLYWDKYKCSCSNVLEFIKEIVIVPNLLYWDKYKCSCSNVLEAIQVNGEKWDVDIMNLFCFTLKDAISDWGENFM
jgi:hypothetical protein